MRTIKKWINRKIFSFIVLLILISYYLYYLSLTKNNQPFIPRVRLNYTKIGLFKKISIAHYTTSYGARTDSHSNIFNTNLKQICSILDP